MWDIIKKIKGIPLDPYDQVLDAMLQRTLASEVIPFDEWQDLVDDITEEQENSPDIEEVLRERGLSLPELVEQAEAARREFLDKLQKFALPLENRFELCRKLCELAQTSPTDELLRLYCDIVCDGGFLLDLERGTDEGAVSWLYGKEDSDTLYGYFSEQLKLASRWSHTLAQMQKTGPLRADRAEETSKELDKVFQLYCGIFEPAKNVQRLKDNLAWLMWTADHSKDLAPIKPLFLYRILTRLGSRLQTSEDPQIDSRALWNYKHYQIEKHNGKNYKTNWKYLALFHELCDIFKTDPQVDIPLCVCGFSRLSNLCEFFWKYPEPGWEPTFLPPMEELLDESMFSCFENRCEDNVILRDSGLSEKELRRFRESEERRFVRGSLYVEKFMNNHLDELVAAFLPASPEEVKTLCTEILKNSAIPRTAQPREGKETMLYLAAINDCLMEAVDKIALGYLVQTGASLVR